MAKTKGPLLSLDAHGSLSKLLTFSNKRTGQQVRKYNKPLVTPSAKQRGQRRLTEFLVAQWQNLSAGDKATWETNAKASGRNLPGYQYFLREAQRDLYTHHGLCGYWHCNEIVAGKVLDLSGKGNHGTLGPSYPANAPILADAPFAKFGKTARFDGIDDNIAVAHNAIFDFGVGDFSVAFRLFINGDQDDKEPIGKWDYPTYSRGWFCRIEAGPVMTFTISAVTGSSSNYQEPVTANIWLEIVLRRVSTAMDIFSDGVLLSSQPQTIRNVNCPDVLSIGAHTATNRQFLGDVDEVCIYNRGLTDAEIATRYKFALQEAG